MTMSVVVFTLSSINRELRIVALPVTKHPPFSPPFCATLAQGATIFTREIWVRLTYVCKILSRSVKVFRSYLRKDDFWQINITRSWRGVQTDVYIGRWVWSYKWVLSYYTRAVFINIVIVSCVVSATSQTIAARVLLPFQRDITLSCCSTKLTMANKINIA